MIYKGLLTYGAMTTKISGMMGKMLSMDDFRELASQRSVQDAVNYIKSRTGYGEVLQNIAGEIHREKLENLLRHSLYNDYIKLRHYIRMQDAEFIRLIMSRYEMQIIKAVIRNCIVNQSPGNYLYDIPEGFEKILSFGVSKLVSAKNMEDVQEALEGSPFHKVLSILYARGGRPSLFEIETNLDIYYFSTMWRLIERSFSGEGKKQIQQIVGTEADILNVLWIYRCKRYYNLPNEHVYALLLPVHYKLSNETIQRLVETNDFEDFFKEVQNTKYGKLIENESHTLFEKAMMRLLTEIFKKLKNISPYNITTVLGYIYAKELELENICSVIEGVRYGLSSDKIMSYVM